MLLLSSGREVVGKPVLVPTPIPDPAFPKKLSPALHLDSVSVMKGGTLIEKLVNYDSDSEAYSLTAAGKYLSKPLDGNTQYTVTAEISNKGLVLYDGPYQINVTIWGGGAASDHYGLPVVFNNGGAPIVVRGVCKPGTKMTPQPSFTFTSGVAGKYQIKVSVKPLP